MSRLQQWVARVRGSRALRGSHALRGIDPALQALGRHARILIIVLVGLVVTTVAVRATDLPVEIQATLIPAVPTLLVTLSGSGGPKR